MKLLQVVWCCVCRGDVINDLYFYTVNEKLSYLKYIMVPIITYTKYGWHGISKK